MNIERMLKVNKSLESLMKAKLRYINQLASHKKLMTQLDGVVIREDSTITSEELQQVLDLSNKVVSNGRLEPYVENSNFGFDEVDKVLASKRSFSSTESTCQGGVQKRQLQNLKNGQDKRINIMAQCKTILKRLMNYKHGYQVFNQPVDAKLEGLYDYHLIIKRPMDLGTIKKKLNARIYTHPKQFVADVRLTFANAQKYNPETHDVHRVARTLEAIFEAWWEDLATKMDLDIEDGDPGVATLLSDVLPPRDGDGENSWCRQSGVTSERDCFLPLAAARKHDRLLGPRIRKRSPKPHPSDPHKRLMRPEELEKLKADLELLPGDKVERVARILEGRQKPVTVSEGSDEIIIEPASLDNDTLWELDRFIRNYKKSRGKKSKLSMLMQHSLAAEAVDGTILHSAHLEDQNNEEVDIDIVDDLPPVPINQVVIDPESCESDSESSCSDDSGSTCKNDPHAEHDTLNTLRTSIEQ